MSDRAARFTIPLRTRSASNLREHWGSRARRTKRERSAARLICAAAPRPPCIVTLTRLAPRRLDDDNLASALKGVRDGIADALRVDDGDPRVVWRYAQRRGGYAVDVEIASREAIRALKKERRDDSEV